MTISEKGAQREVFEHAFCRNKKVVDTCLLQKVEYVAIRAGTLGAS